MKTILTWMLFVLTVFSPQSAFAYVPGKPQTWEMKQGRYKPIVGARGMVVADERKAAEWGAEILRKGGNAIDAAVATAFAMSVSRPNHSSLGGGGFMVYCPAPKGKKKDCVVLDYREQAPSNASRDMYLRNGKADTKLSQNGALAPGVPGVVAGLLTAHKKYGKKTRREILSRPIQMAKQGIFVSGHMEDILGKSWKRFNPEAKKVFGCRRYGTQKRPPCTTGKRVRQKDLARVLEAVSTRGKSGFYRGWVAQKIVAGLKKAGGIMTLQDLVEYRPRWRKPVAKSFGEYEIVSMPPPSAGGANILQMFHFAHLAEKSGAFRQGWGDTTTLHAIAHGMALAFSDRAKHFGDPDHYKVPLERLLDANYLNSRWQKTWKSDAINLPKDAGKVGDYAFLHESKETTHFSVVDKDGNAVSITTTVNANFGSGFIPPGTGIVMNNEMDDFSAQPGVPNLYGLVGAEANAIAPRKRPLSSMSPTIVRDNQGEARIVIGASGGPRITTSVYLSLLKRLKFNMSLPDAVLTPRIHHQWRPEVLFVESNSFGPEIRNRLKGMGYSLKEILASARIHALERFPNQKRVWGVPDRRAEGVAVPE